MAASALFLLTTLFLTRATPSTTPRGLIPILDPILNLGASAPPKFLQTHNPSPKCAAVNSGELMCCRGTVAGDLQIVTFLAGLYGYHLNPNDVNGLDCDKSLDNCPGVKVCCQVTALAPLLSLYCQDL